ncbi:MAG: preprotein translocase subunit SecE [Clostridia bacterium]|nr:preprotein translocase subunit SecE [Clostridia bacterium]
MAENTKVKKPGKIASFFRDLKTEFKRISWPSFKQVVNNTGIVLAFVIILALFIALVDFAFTYLLTFIK